MRAAKAAGRDIYEQVFGPKAKAVRRFNRLDPKFVWVGTTVQVPELPEGDDYVPMPAEYPPAKDIPKFVLVALNLQFMGVYEHGMLVASFPICSGAPKHGTPIGDFKIKDKNKDMKSNMYPPPNGGAPMPWASNFHRTEYWFHGGDMVGYRASHGCVRMFKAEAEWLFHWAVIGTPVKIVDILR
jgi:lipoprotein-anchoring transpeptidase ErfK/SrfK